MLKEIIETASLHLNRAAADYDDIKEFPVDESIYDHNERIKTIDAFLFRFIKLQDYMGDKLFREVLKSLGEYKDNMSLIDIVDKLEKFDIIEDSDNWIAYRNLRNELTHEYPFNKEETLEGIKTALDCFENIKNVFEKIVDYLIKRGLYK